MANPAQDIFLPFKGPEMARSPRASPIPAGQWTQHQEIIRHLYIDQKKTLDEVMETMKRKYGFHATSRQYTLKFQSWHLHKNTRHATKRKPRRAASVYQFATGGGGRHPPRQEFTGAVPDRRLEPASDQGRLEPASDQGSIRHDVDSTPAILESMLRDSFDSTQFSITNESQRNAITVDRPDDARQPAWHNALSEGGLGVEHETQGGQGALRAPNRGPPEPTGVIPTHLAGLNINSVSPSVLQERPLPMSEFGEQGTAENQRALILAIWGAWFSGQASEAHSISNVVEHYFLPERDAAEIDPVALELDEWAALYPQRSKDASFSGGRPPVARNGADRLLLKMYTDRGCVIASRKMARALARREAYVSQSTGKLVAAMLLDRGDTARLRLCFSLILTELERVLEDHFKDLEMPWRSFIDLFPARISGLGDPGIAGHSQRKHEAAMLAMVCDQEFKARGVYERLAFSDVGAIVHEKCVLIWAARLVLYYAAPMLAISPLPPNLCLRALDGCRQILHRIHDHSRRTRTTWEPEPGQNPVPDQWQDARFASIWAEWICCDSDFFLSHQPTHSHEETHVPRDPFLSHQPTYSHEETHVPRDFFLSLQPIQPHDETGIPGNLFLSHQLTQSHAKTDTPRDLPRHRAPHHSTSSSALVHPHSTGRDGRDIAQDATLDPADYTPDSGVVDYGNPKTSESPSWSDGQAWAFGHLFF